MNPKQKSRDRKREKRRRAAKEQRLLREKALRAGTAPAATGSAPKTRPATA